MSAPHGPHWSIDIDELLRQYKITHTEFKSLLTELNDLTGHGVLFLHVAIAAYHQPHDGRPIPTQYMDGTALGASVSVPAIMVQDRFHQSSISSTKRFAPLPESDTIRPVSGNARLTPQVVHSESTSVFHREKTTTKFCTWNESDSSHARILQMLTKRPWLKSWLEAIPEDSWTYRLPIPNQPGANIDFNFQKHLLQVDPSLTFHLPEFGAPWLLSAKFPFLFHVRRIALPFDAACCPDLDAIERFIDHQGLAWALAHFPNLEEIYLVDRAIGKKWGRSIPDYEGLKRDKFYANGFTYVEIMYEDEHPFQTSPSFWDRLGSKGSHTLVWRLKEMLEDALVTIPQARKMLKWQMKHGVAGTAGASLTDHDPMKGWGDRKIQGVGCDVDNAMLNDERIVVRIPKVKILSLLK